MLHCRRRLFTPSFVGVVGGGISRKEVELEEEKEGGGGNQIRKGRRKEGRKEEERKEGKKEGIKVLV